MRAAITEFFASKDEGFYRRGIYSLAEKWEEVIDADGEYFD